MRRVSLLFWGIWGLTAVAIVSTFSLVLFKLTKGTLVALSFPEFKDAQAKAWSFLLLCIAIGALTMSFVQVCRALFPFRGKFHRREILAWFDRTIPQKTPGGWAPIVGRVKVDKPSAEQALKEFEDMCSRGSLDLGLREGRSDSDDLYDLPLEQLCGQLTLAAESALEKPNAFPNFLLCVVGIEAAEDLLNVLPGAGPAAGAAAAPPLESSASVQEIRARSSLSRIIQRRIDAFQIGAGAAWRHTLQGAVMIVNVSFSWLLAATIIRPTNDIGSWLTYLIYAGLAGILATFLSMFLRDLTAVVELKRRH